MAFFRAYIAPLLIVLTFLFAMLAVSVRSFLPGDMLAPAPIEEVAEEAAVSALEVAPLPPDVSMLLHGQPDLAG